MQLTTGQKLVFIGDSITDAGRVQPVAEGLFDPLGRGYVTMVEALIGATYPHLGVRVVNVGTSGNTVRDLAARWQRDVLDLKPDWLGVCIGINDVWRQFDSPRQKEIHVPVDEYERTLDELIGRTKPVLRGGLVMLSPFYVEASKADAMRAAMDRYGAAMKRVAQKHTATFVDTQAAFDAALRHYYPATLAWDRVHPNQIGHMVLARAFLKAVGYQW